MRKLSILLSFSTLLASAQGPEVTNWILNPGSETGYGGYLTNVQTVSYTDADVYVACTCIPGYDIGPWAGNPNTPANQNFVFKITRTPVENTGSPVATGLGHIAVLRNGVSVFNAKDAMSYNNQGIWNRNALIFEGASFDACLGHPAPNGEYHHHVSPNCVYDHLNDEQHAGLIGYAFDGFPIYGAYGFANANGTGGPARMRSSYQYRSITDRTTTPDGTVLSAGQYGPAIGGAYPLGAFIEDFVFVEGSGDLDEHNGRFCVTPEFPEGHYAYFVTLDEQAAPAFPYVLGPTYYGIVQAGNTGPQSAHNEVPGNAVLYDPSTGVSTIEIEKSISLFPLPTADELTIRSQGERFTQVKLIDPAGRCIEQHTSTGQQMTLQLGGLTAGCYMIEVRFADGQREMRTVVKL